jgi:two-component system nitrate/nitrite response regulator NarL
MTVIDQVLELPLLLIQVREVTVMNNMLASVEIDPSHIEVGEAHSGLTPSKKPNIRIIVADDHPIVRDGIRRLLTLETDFEVVGEAADGREVIELVTHLDPDVLLLDLRMPNLDGLSALQTLQQTNRRTKIIVLTASEDKNEFVQAMKLGCSGIVLKQTAPDLIVKSIRKVHAGEIWLDSHTTAAVMRQFAAPGSEGSGPSLTSNGKPRERSPLSTREREIVTLVAQGYKNKEMAEKMFISEQTVKNHLHNIFDKLGVSDRLELALYAIHKGLHLNG